MSETASISIVSHCYDSLSELACNDALDVRSIINKELDTFVSTRVVPRTIASSLFWDEAFLIYNYKK
jgi:hypothetical protein